MSRILLHHLLLCLLFLQGASLGAEDLPLSQPPSLITTAELRDFDKVAKERQEIIKLALSTGKAVKGLPYRFGGNGVKDGGFDCSGAMYSVLRQAGLKPPRSSSEQYLWVKNSAKLHEVSTTAKDTDDKSLANLKPGDLIFWSGTYAPTDGRQTKITHVAIFLGHEKKDGRPVMINASNGRSYRGKKCNGFGVYDFVVPKSTGKARIVGYGTPPGLID